MCYDINRVTGTMEIYIYVPDLRPTHGSPGESQGSGVALLFAFHCVMVVCTIELKGIGREGEGCKLDHRF